jgi:hypothetical protein
MKAFSFSDSQDAVEGLGRVRTVNIPTRERNSYCLGERIDLGGF